MAKHRGRKGRKTSSSAFQALPVNQTIALATLADQTVLMADLTAIADDMWMQSADLSWTLRDAAVGEGPIAVGLAHNDLSVSEVKEAINAVPASRSDIVARERSRRPVRRVGQFTGGVATSEVALFNGVEKRTPVKMYFAESSDLAAYAMNQSGATLTTGAVVTINGTIYGTWK